MLLLNVMSRDSETQTQHAADCCTATAAGEQQYEKCPGLVEHGGARHEADTKLQLMEFCRLV